MILTHSIASLTRLTATSPTPTNGDGNEAGLWLLLALAALIYGTAYAISIRRHPYRACRRCGGTGKHRGTWFTTAFRACDWCGGAGRERRLFARGPYNQNEHKRRARQ